MVQSGILWSLVLACVVYFLSMYQLSHYNDKLDFKFKTYGDSSKPPVVIIPGLDGAVNFFSDVLPELSPNYYVILFHIPLCERARDRSTYTFDFIANELHAVLKGLHVKSKVSILGESFGGVIAQYYAINHPNSIEKLVLLSSLAKTELPPAIQFKLDYLLPIIEGVGQYFPALAQKAFAQIHVYDIMEPSEAEFVRRLFIKEASHAHFYSVMARIRIVSKLNIVEKAKKIIAPTLIIYGADDHFTKPSSIELHGYLKNSVMRSLPGGHLPHITSPKAFVTLVHGFLKQQ